ncbi:hypothetical protein Hanom_Chr06g00531651 [Helianthus anomalus]
MKNQNRNPLDSTFDSLDPNEVSKRFVVDIGESLYDKVGNKSLIAFFRKLEREVKVGFHIMKTAQTYLKRAPRVRNPDTGKPLKTMMWFPTRKVKTFPLPKIQVLQV